MAGAFTHMALVAEAKKSFTIETIFGRILTEHESFVTLGAVSPDIPYLSQLNLGIGATWADIFHYHKTNGIVHNGLHSLVVSKESKGVKERQLAWLAGFTSHLVADATIHPIVEAIVGPCTCPASKDEHTFCEMTQDIMIFKREKNMELNASDYTRHIDDCIGFTKYFASVTQLWSHLAMMNYPSAGLPDLNKLIRSYKDVLDTADGGNILARMFRHIGMKYIYKRFDELTDEEISKYYDQVILPNGVKGSFKTEGYDYAVRNIVEAWRKIESFLYSKRNVAEIVPDWNLDTGIEQTNNIRTFWS